MPVIIRTIRTAAIPTAPIRYTLNTPARRSAAVVTPTTAATPATATPATATPASAAPTTAAAAAPKVVTIDSTNNNAKDLSEPLFNYVSRVLNIYTNQSLLSS